MTYVHPEALVETDWVAAHLHDAGVRLIEVDVDTYCYYDEAHLPGSLAWDWTTQLLDQTTRDIVSKAQFEALMGDAGVRPGTTVVFYGDNNNWFAAYAFWVATIYGHADVRLMNGGRDKWIAEGRELTEREPRLTRTDYVAAKPDLSVRAMLPEIMSVARERAHHLIDARSPAEFSGQIMAPPGLAETAQRAGHIPGAVCVPWEVAVRDDGCFRPREELRAVYAKAGIDGSKPIVVYCRAGERSAVTWFVLKQLLGFRDVRLYDGSWTEWGNLVGVPIER